MPDTHLPQHDARPGRLNRALCGRLVGAWQLCVGGAPTCAGCQQAQAEYEAESI